MGLRLSARDKRAVRTWVRLLQGHAAMSRTLGLQMQARHGLTLSDFAVLRHLSEAPDGRMRRIDLAAAVGLTPSGITRLLNGLQDAGLVCRSDCASDARVSYAALTDAGRTAFEAAARDNAAAVQAILSERYSDEELEQLGALLERLPGTHDGGPACGGE